MNIFKSNHFSELYYEMLNFAFYSEVPLSESRVGSVKDFGPAYYELSGEDSRLIYLNNRSLNPFFALVEFSWIVSGSNALNPLQHFIKNYDKYSDDGKTLNGAYGYRLRHYFSVDQIEKCVQLLKTDNETRRVVLTIWAASDLGADSKDLPCHTTVYLKVRNGKLDLTVLNRSNDLYFGVPYDILTFYLLQGYLADRIERSPGVQRHFVDSLHLYEKDIEVVGRIIKSNNRGALQLIKRTLVDFDVLRYIRSEHDKIAVLAFDEIKDEVVRKFFKSYETYEERGDFKEAVEQLPRNILGYVAYLWFRSRRAFPLDARLTEYEELIRELEMKSDLETLETIKYKDEEEIVNFIEEMADRYTRNYNELVGIVQKENSIFTVREGSKENVLKAIFLALVLAKVTSNLYNKSLSEKLMGKIERVSDKIKVNYSDLIRMASYEDELLQTLSISA